MDALERWRYADEKAAQIREAAYNERDNALVEARKVQEAAEVEAYKIRLAARKTLGEATMPDNEFNMAWEAANRAYDKAYNAADRQYLEARNAANAACDNALATADDCCRASALTT
jgi:hypothetical protein